MGQACCKFANPLRFWGVHKFSPHRFSRLKDNQFAFDLKIQGDTQIVLPAYRESHVCSSASHKSNVGENHLVTNLQQVSVETFFHEHVTFPFLTDDDLGKLIINTRYMIILRGLPGSGKSYVASCIKMRFPTTKICSADQFWYLESGGTEYRYESHRLEDAHDFCRDNAYKFVSESCSPLVIDNTNVRAWECRYYLELARKFDYNVILVVPRTPWRFDAQTLVIKNIHNVPASVIASRIRQFETVYPLYYGWFWPGQSSARTLTQTRPNYITPIGPHEQCVEFIMGVYKQFIAILEVCSMRSVMAQECELPPDVDLETLASHWRSATLPGFGPVIESSLYGHERLSRPHITAFFSNMGRAPGAREYADRSEVSEALLGSMHTVSVLGLFITKRSVGLRIRLGDHELAHLWGSDDNAGRSSSQPVRPIGCRAHVTLALANDVPAVETGLDLLRLVDAELAGSPDVASLPILEGTLHDTLISSLSLDTSFEPIEHAFYYEYNKPKAYKLCYGAYY